MSIQEPWVLVSFLITAIVIHFPFWASFISSAKQKAWFIHVLLSLISDIFPGLLSQYISVGTKSLHFNSLDFNKSSMVFIWKYEKRWSISKVLEVDAFGYLWKYPMTSTVHLNSMNYLHMYTVHLGKTILPWISYPKDMYLEKHHILITQPFKPSLKSFHFETPLHSPGTLHKVEFVNY